MLLDEQDADRGGYIDHRASLVGQFPGFLIDAVGSDGVGVCTGSKQPVGTWG